MSQITLRKLPENIEKQIKNLAKRNRVSINKTVISLLEKALGTERESKRKRDLSKLAGTWDESESNEFDHLINNTFGKVDEEIWSQ